MLQHFSRSVCDGREHLHISFIVCLFASETILIFNSDNNMIQIEIDKKKNDLSMMKYNLVRPPDTSRHNISIHI